VKHIFDMVGEYFGIMVGGWAEVLYRLMELIKTTLYAYNWKVTATVRRWGWEKEMGIQRGLFPPHRCR